MVTFQQFVAERIAWRLSTGQDATAEKTLWEAMRTPAYHCASPRWSHVQAAIRDLALAQKDYARAHTIRQTAALLEHPYQARRYEERQEAAEAARLAARNAREAKKAFREEAIAEKRRLRALERAGRRVTREERLAALRKEAEQLGRAHEAEIEAKRLKKRADRIALRGLAFVEEAERLRAELNAKEAAKQAPKLPSPFDP